MDLRLAEHITRDGRIGKRAVDGLTRIVKAASVRSKELNSDEFLALATSAIREATNGKEVITQVKSETGVRLTVLPGRDEAMLTFLAVRRWYGWSSGRLLVADIGGGSVELAIGSGEQPDEATSIPLGAGRMFREFFDEDPPKRSQVRALRSHVSECLTEVLEKYDGRSAEHAVGTSKTFRQLARLSAPYTPHGQQADERLLRADSLEALCTDLVKMDVAQRAKLPRISETRAPQLAAGALVALEIMQTLRIDELEVCPWALREGIILRRLAALKD
jgi:exopolyphosphatase/guanosine-5'-triphosphate,3'-diphosphate pyrophosphatase